MLFFYTQNNFLLQMNYCKLFHVQYFWDEEEDII